MVDEPLYVFLVFVAVHCACWVCEVAAGFESRPDIFNYFTLTLSALFNRSGAPFWYCAGVFSEHPLSGTGGINKDEVILLASLGKGRWVQAGHIYAGITPFGDVVAEGCGARADELVGSQAGRRADCNACRRTGWQGGRSPDPQAGRRSTSEHCR